MDSHSQQYSSNSPSKNYSLQIRLGRTLAWVFAAPVLAGLGGGAVTWWQAGADGVWAQAAAFAVAAGLAMTSVFGLRWLAGRAARKPGTNVAFVVAQAFMYGGMARIMFLVLIGLAVWYAASLATTPFFIWLATFGFLTLIGESIALTRWMKSSTKPGDQRQATSDKRRE